MKGKKSLLWRAALMLMAGILVYIGLSLRDKERIERYEVSYFNLFDTVIHISGYAKNEEEFDKQMEQVRTRLEYFAQRYDIYRDYPDISNLKTVNDNAGKMPVKVDREVLDLIELGKEMYYKSDGKLNIAFGSVLKLWHDHREEGMKNPKSAKLPERSALEEAAKHANIEDVVIDRGKQTIFLRDQKMSLDVGALAKGYAVERVAKEMEKSGLSGYLLNVGGNVRAVGAKPERKPWSVGIQNPSLPRGTDYVEVVQLVREVLVTSGGYQRFYMIDGKAYHHIIDPKTLMPAQYVESVSVVGKDNGKEDAHSTIAFNMPLEESKEYIEGIRGVEAMWILKNGEIVHSSGFDKYMKGK